MSCFVSNESFAHFQLDSRIVCFFSRFLKELFPFSVVKIVTFHAYFNHYFPHNLFYLYIYIY